MKNQYIKTFLLTILISFVLGCGGSGGSSDSKNTPIIDPGDVAVSVTPTSVTPGDRILVRIYLSNVNPDGIILKIRTPASIKYYNDSGALLINNSKVDINPTFYQIDKASKYNYLVYFFPIESFDSHNQGEIQVQYLATAALNVAQIAADVKFQDPNIDPTKQFDIDNPLFSAKAYQNISVLSK